MKICLLLTLIGTIVAFSHVPIRRTAKAAKGPPPEIAAAFTING